MFDHRQVVRDAVTPVMLFRFATLIGDFFLYRGLILFFLPGSVVFKFYLHLVFIPLETLTLAAKKHPPQLGHLVREPLYILLLLLDDLLLVLNILFSVPFLVCSPRFSIQNRLD
jgi:hypothetical protein